MTILPCLYAAMVLVSQGAWEESVLHRAMAAELDRSMDSLALEAARRPYYLEYRVRESHAVIVRAEFGALVEDRDPFPNAVQSMKSALVSPFLSLRRFTATVNLAYSDPLRPVCNSMSLVIRPAPIHLFMLFEFLLCFLFFFMLPDRESQPDKRYCAEYP